MTFQYDLADLELQAFAGRLPREKPLIEELNPLQWISLEENFFDMDRFADEGSVGLMLLQVQDAWEQLFPEADPHAAAT